LRTDLPEIFTKRCCVEWTKSLDIAPFPSSPPSSLESGFTKCCTGMACVQYLALTQAGPSSIVFCCNTGCLMSVRTCGFTLTQRMTFRLCAIVFIHAAFVRVHSRTNSRGTSKQWSSHLPPRQHGMSPL